MVGVSPNTGGVHPHLLLTQVHILASRLGRLGLSRLSQVETHLNTLKTCYIFDAPFCSHLCIMCHHHRHSHVNLLLCNDILLFKSVDICQCWSHFWRLLRKCI